MATIGTLISTAVVGIGFWLMAHALDLAIPLSWALVFGALISPTDPVPRQASRNWRPDRCQKFCRPFARRIAAHSAPERLFVAYNLKPQSFSTRHQASFGEVTSCKPEHCAAQTWAVS
jgi:hypothetical protein